MIQTKNILAAASVLASSLAIPAHAAPIASFETDFAPFSTIGDASLESAGFGIAPTQGAQVAVITTAFDDGDDGGTDYNLSGNAPIAAGNVGGLEEQVGLAIGDLDQDINNDGFGPDSAGEGSALVTTLPLAHDGHVSFDWNLLTNEDPGAIEFFYDFAFVLIDGALDILANAIDDATVASGSAYASETGWRTFTTFLTAGSHDIAIGILDHGDDFAPSFINSSALAVDNLDFVPTPGVPALMAIGLAGLLGRRAWT